MRKNGITVREVAELAGVSNMSVSLAFKGSPRVGEATKKRIFEAARQLNYVPNQAARQLRSGRTDAVGFLVPDLANPFHSMMIRHAENAFRKMGLTLFSASCGWSAELEYAFAERLIQMRVRGVLICPCEKDFRAVELLERMMDGRADRNTVISIKPKGVITRRSTDVTAVEDETLRQAAMRIAHDISVHFGPAQIADELGIPLRQLNAKSKRELGHSILDEIVRLRIEEAKRLILSTNDKLSTIAAATGFCNASYFSKVFKGQTGLTPNAWRQHHVSPSSPSSGAKPR